MEYLLQSMGLFSRKLTSAHFPGDQDSISGQRLKKLYLIPPCLTLSIIRYISKIKWSNPGKGVVHSPTPQCSS